MLDQLVVVSRTEEWPKLVLARPRRRRLLSLYPFVFHSIRKVPILMLTLVQSKHTSLCRTVQNKPTSHSIKFPNIVFENQF